jgi:hypothetical protein
VRCTSSDEAIKKNADFNMQLQHSGISMSRTINNKRSKKYRNNIL